MTVKRALIVDDSTTAQHRLKKMLQAYALEIDVVSSGEAALLYLARHVPDVVFMDHMMPGMDGFRVLQIIKSHPETAMIPVVMYTSRSGDVYTGQARALGALDVISKDAINSVELSKVMHTIHIDPIDDSDRKEIPAGERNAAGATASLPDENTEKIAAQAARQVAADNSRRIELRIVQLEHAIDDSRRVIAAQLIREMQKLRHHIKHELARSLNDQQTKAGTALNTEPAAADKPVNSKMPYAIGMLLILLILVVINYQRGLHNGLHDLREQQSLQHQQLTGVEASLLNIQAEQIEQIQRQEVQVSASADQIPTINQWSDFVWAFNQSGTMPFTPRLIEPGIPLKLHEFVTRLSRQGFTGTLWINFSIGDFCVVMDSYGQAQLPDSSTSVSGCMLLSELYPFERTVEQGVIDINAALMSIETVNSGDITVVISSNAANATPYPERESQLPASEWNRVALGKNQVTVSLRPPEPEQRPIINERIIE